MESSTDINIKKAAARLVRVLKQSGNLTGNNKCAYEVRVCEVIEGSEDYPIVLDDDESSRIEETTTPSPEQRDEAAAAITPKTEETEMEAEESGNNFTEMAKLIRAVITSNEITTKKIIPSMEGIEKCMQDCEALMSRIRSKQQQQLESEAATAGLTSGQIYTMYVDLTPSTDSLQFLLLRII